MHNAPSVSYPVGRCAFHRWLYLSTIALTSAVLFTWALSQGLSWSWGVAAGAAAVGTYLGRQAQQQIGVLTWDGQVWCLHDQGLGLEDALGEVRVMLDVQKALLLRWQPASDTLHAQPIWLWLDAEQSPACWQEDRKSVV